MAVFILVNGKMIYSMVRALLLILNKKDIQAISFKAKSMEKENMIMLMELFIKEIGKLMKNMEEGKFIYLMVTI